MNTTTKSDNASKTNNKTVFAPLGKYAVVGVIMVSIIVTTAIMLDKQLSTVENEIAAIESEVADLNKTDAETTVVADNDKNTLDTTIATNDLETKDSPIEVTVAEVETSSDQVLVTDTQETISEENLSTEQDAMAAVEKTETAEVVTMSQDTQNRQAQFAMSNNEQQFKARIAAYKVEQKQRMTDMFARIKTLEAQQLDQYKASQAKQIVRLRQQVSNQQEMIEALVLRNKDLFELRAANVQRVQTNREEVLNRI